MDDLESRLGCLERDVREIKSILLRSVEPQCMRMGEHISFVEGVYRALRWPLARLWRGAPPAELPLCLHHASELVDVKGNGAKEINSEDGPRDIAALS